MTNSADQELIWICTVCEGRVYQGSAGQGLKGVYSKRKEFPPLGSKFFPFRVDPFSEGAVYSKRKAISYVPQSTGRGTC